MIKVQDLLRNRNIILILSLATGLIWGQGAQWTETTVLPALSIAMTLSVMGITGDSFRSLRTFITPALAGIIMNYVVLGGIILALSKLFIHDEALWIGFVILAAVPPAVAVIPFTLFLKGDTDFSIIGTISAYLGALLITPLMVLLFIGTSFVDPLKLMIITIELIFAPLLFARILIMTGIARLIEPIKGDITNWSFFLVSYTIVGLNQQVFLTQTMSLLPVAIISFMSTFLLGWIIGLFCKIARLDKKKTTSIVLLGTLKNYGLAGGLALSFFDTKTALPSTVSVVFMIIYIIWLEFKKNGLNNTEFFS
jgi:BASS family bile acid:Na+ symporter